MLLRPRGHKSSQLRMRAVNGDFLWFPPGFTDHIWVLSLPGLRCSDEQPQGTVCPYCLEYSRSVIRDLNLELPKHPDPPKDFPPPPTVSSTFLTPRRRMIGTINDAGWQQGPASWACLLHLAGLWVWDFQTEPSFFPDSWPQSAAPVISVRISWLICFTSFKTFGRLWCQY
jgi:hypothetical protein